MGREGGGRGRRARSCEREGSGVVNECARPRTSSHACSGDGQTPAQAGVAVEWATPARPPSERRGAGENDPPLKKNAASAFFWSRTTPIPAPPSALHAATQTPHTSIHSPNMTRRAEARPSDEEAMAVRVWPHRGPGDVPPAGKGRGRGAGGTSTAGSSSMAACSGQCVWESVMCACARAPKKN